MTMVLSKSHGAVSEFDPTRLVDEIYVISQAGGVIQRPRKYVLVECSDDDMAVILDTAVNVRCTEGDHRGRRQWGAYMLPDGTQVPDDIEVISASLEGPLDNGSSEETSIVPIERMWRPPVPVVA